MVMEAPMKETSAFLEQAKYAEKLRSEHALNIM